MRRIYQAVRTNGRLQGGLVFLRVAACALFVVFLSGCYSSPVSLDKKSGLPLKSYWLGTWTMVDEEEKKGGMTVRAYKDNWYEIDYYEINSDGERKWSKFYAFASLVDNTTIMSIRKPDSDSWNFVRVWGRGDRWSLAPLGINSIDSKFSASEDLYRAMHPIVHDSDSYLGVYTFRRGG